MDTNLDKGTLEMSAGDGPAGTQLVDRALEPVTAARDDGEAVHRLVTRVPGFGLGGQFPRVVAREDRLRLLLELEAVQAAELGVEMPLTRAVTTLLSGRASAREVVEALLRREAKPENR